MLLLCKQPWKGSGSKKTARLPEKWSDEASCMRCHPNNTCKHMQTHCGTHWSAQNVEKTPSTQHSKCDVYFCLYATCLYQLDPKMYCTYFTKPDDTSWNQLVSAKVKERMTARPPRSPPAVPEIEKFEAHVPVHWDQDALPRVHTERNGILENRLSFHSLCDFSPSKGWI